MTSASTKHLHRAGIMHAGQHSQSPHTLVESPSASDEEANLCSPRSPGISASTSLPHFNTNKHSGNGFIARLRKRNQPKRRPTAVRVAEDRYDHQSTHERSSPRSIRPSANTERTPLIKAGVKPDIRWTGPATGERQNAEIGLGRMVELGLPLIM